MASTLVTPVAVVAAVLGALLAAIVPTCLYLYVEPRGRLNWRAHGADGIRGAPPLVRFTAWLSFALGQLALPWLLVPAACGVLIYLQARLGVGRSFGVAATLAAGAMALVQSLLAVRLLRVGVGLLARDARRWEAVGRIAKGNGLASALLLGLGATMSWGFAAVPGLVHPWLRAALVWTALRPVAAYAALCLIHAVLLGRCARLLADSSR
jgi:hypothetical protein